MAEAAVKHEGSKKMDLPVKIESRLLRRIGIREWGLPSMVMPGQIWRSQENQTISCMTPLDDLNVKIESRKLEVLNVGEMSWLPDHWRYALWEYVQRWPDSGCKYGPFLAINEIERNQFLRNLGKRLVDSDEIGCRSIANSIGEFAAWGFEIVSDRQKSFR